MTKKKIILISLCAFVLLIGVFLFLVYQGTIRFNSPSKETYPVRGVDVSMYQGDIDWKVLETQEIDFAFIKATEGSSYVDEQFEKNWTDAQSTNLRIGAYHFFSFDSAGESQAESFIKAVPKTVGMLPPVVDIELYGKHKTSPPKAKEVQKNLMDYLGKIELHYGMKPIIYTTSSAHRRYIKEKFDDYDLWFRNVFTPPFGKATDNWTFWQYSDRAILKGYQGEEKYIDMNVFSGTKEEFLNY